MRSRGLGMAGHVGTVCVESMEKANIEVEEVKTVFHTGRN